MRAVVLLCLLHAAAAQNFAWNPPSRDVPVDPNSNNACGVDQPSCECCSMVKEVNRLKTYFNSTLTGLEQEYLKTNQSLQSFQANRAAFSVSMFTNDNFRCYGFFSTDTVIPYKQIFLNFGAAYNADTGIFTVPFSGVYSLAVTSFSDAGSPGALLNVCTSLQVNGLVIARAREINTKDQEDSASIVVALQLNAGDKVSVVLAKNCYLCDDYNHYNTFSAFLLYSSS